LKKIELKSSFSLDVGSLIITALITPPLALQITNWDITYTFIFRLFIGRNGSYVKLVQRPEAARGPYFREPLTIVNIMHYIIGPFINCRER